MKTIKRLTVLTGTAVLAGTLLSPSAFAATGVLPDGASAGNGRDHGWGNCGYNNGSGGAVKRTGQELRARTGMGGYSKADAASCTGTSPTTGSGTSVPVEQPALDPAPDPAPVTTVEETDVTGTIDLDVVVWG